MQIQDPEGRLFTLYDEVEEEWMWEVRNEPHTFMSGADQPDLQTVSVCYVQCRWEDLFTDVVSRMSAKLDFPLWVLDSDGNVWSADAIDPDRLVL